MVENVEVYKNQVFLEKLSSKEELKNWVYLFLDIELPDGHIYPLSNSSPAEAIWKAYSFIKDNEGQHDKRGFVWMSSRDSFKTLSQAILNILLMLHFRSTIAHMAAIESQSHKVLQYLNSFILKITPYLKAHGIEIDSQSKRIVKLKFPNGDQPYIKVIIATLAGANSEHTNILTLDELDVLRDYRVLEEALSIPSMQNNKFPMIIKTSTRKFAGGIMEQQVQNAAKNKEELLQWNIIDITEYCPPEKNLKNDPERIKLFIRPFKLPLSTLTEEELNNLPTEEQKIDYIPIEAPKGCAKCPILPLCQTKLADRHPSQKGGLYRPLSFVITEFQTKNPDYAEAQLLCLKPSRIGLVYGRFDPTIDKGNVWSLSNAYEKIFGEKYIGNITFDILLESVKKIGIKFYAGIDWGYTHDSSIVVVGVFPTFSILFETFSQPGMELQDLLSVALKLNEKYGGITKWFADQAAPANIKTFKRAGLFLPEFKKDVLGGIEALRGQILSGTTRKFFVLDTPENARAIEGFLQHSFERRADGSLTANPDDKMYADIMDALRYLAQNLYSRDGGRIISVPPINVNDVKNIEPKDIEMANKQILRNKINEIINSSSTSNGTKSSKNKKVFW